MSSRIASFFALLTACTLFVFSSPAHARTGYTNQVPQAEDNCGLCHIDPMGGGARNSFGQTIGMNLDVDVVDWASACAVDSDGDGYINGVELGDPDCTWVTGDATPDFDFTVPSAANSTPCGNGTVEDPEECEGGVELPADATCAILTPDTPVGDIVCNAANCEFNTLGCMEPANTNNGTNNTNNATNNTNNTTNNTNTNSANNTNNGNTTGPDPDEPDDEPKEVGMACDGELEVDEGDSAFALIGLLMFVALRRRD